MIGDRRYVDVGMPRSAKGFAPLMKIGEIQSDLLGDCLGVRDDIQEGESCHGDEECSVD